MTTIRGTSAGFLAERLKAHGVRYAFGIPSGQILPVVEAFEQHGIRFVLVSHEMTAGFMADVMGRLTGVPGVPPASATPCSIAPLASSSRDRCPRPSSAGGSRCTSIIPPSLPR
jgi:acetolactate synthase-1/2/3 large subunit